VEQGLGGVSGPEEKRKKKSAPVGISGYDQTKIESLCTSKLQIFEKFS